MGPDGRGKPSLEKQNRKKESRWLRSNRRKLKSVGVLTIEASERGFQAADRAAMIVRVKGVEIAAANRALAADRAVQASGAVRVRQRSTWIS